MPLRLLFANCQPVGASGFTRAEGTWDTETRRYSERSSQQAVCAVYELADGDQVDEWCDLAGNRIVLRYGAGQYPWTQDSTTTPLFYDVEFDSPAYCSHAGTD